MFLLQQVLMIGSWLLPFYGDVMKISHRYDGDIIEVQEELMGYVYIYIYCQEDNALGRTEIDMKNQNVFPGSHL